MIKLIKLSYLDLIGLQDWVKMNDSFQKHTCPFKKNSSVYIGKWKCEATCFTIFYNEGLADTSNHCPCYVVGLERCIKIANELIAYNKGDTQDDDKTE